MFAAMGLDTLQNGWVKTASGQQGIDLINKSSVFRRCLLWDATTSRDFPLV